MSLIEELKMKKKIKEEAIQEFLDYQNNRSVYEKCHQGIFHPIRAIVKTYTCGNSDLRTIIDDARHIQNIVSLDENPVREDDRSANIWFTRESSIIGYFATWNHFQDSEKKYFIGLSYCRPSDYLLYQKHVALAKAMCPRIIMNEDYLETVCKKGTMRFSDLKAASLDCKKDHIETFEYLNKEGVCVYYFPITLQEQLDEFIRRCARYYKKQN